MLDLAEFTWGRYNSNQVAPAGSYLNLRTLCIFQQTSDGNVPADGTFSASMHQAHRPSPISRQRSTASSAPATWPEVSTPVPVATM